MDAIFHFGMPKTGSTSIQDTLYDLPAEARKGFVYFTPGGKKVNSNRLIEVLYRVAIRNKQKRTPPGELDLAEEQVRLRELLRQQAALKDIDHWILSSEGLVYEQEENLADLRGYFSANGITPRAVGYVRTPKSFMESSFQQKSKGQQVRFSLSRLYPGYRAMFEKFDRVFGRENVECWLFDPKKLLNGCVVQDFTQRIGIEVAPESVVRSNDGLSRQAFSLMFAGQKYVGDFDGSRTPGRAPLVKKLQALKGSKLRFHSSIVAPVLEENREDLQWMEERLGASLTENLEADDAIAIKSEEELMAFEPETLQWLSERLNGKTPLSREVLSGDPEAVGKGVNALREFLLERRGR